MLLAFRGRQITRALRLLSNIKTFCNNTYDESMSILNDTAYPGWLLKVSQKFDVPKSVVTKALAYFRDGATVPFVVRYRQHEIGGIESETAYGLQREYGKFEAVVKLRNSRIDKLKNSGKYDDSIGKRFMMCHTLEELDEAYSSYKESTSTKVQKAMAIPGLEAIAEDILAGTLSSVRRQQDDFHIALGWLLADRIAHHEHAADVVAREGCGRHVVITSTEKPTARSGDASQAGKDKSSNDKSIAKKSNTCVRRGQDDKYKYADYFHFTKPVSLLSTHQTLAIRRGKESASALRVQFSLPDGHTARLTVSLMLTFGVPSVIARQYMAKQGLERSSPRCDVSFPLRRHDIIMDATFDAVKRLIVPTITRAAWRDAVQVAEEEAVRMFSANLKSLLLTPPLRVILNTQREFRRELGAQQDPLVPRSMQGDMVICGVDPGMRQGHKIVIINCANSPEQILHRQKLYCRSTDQVEGTAMELKTLCERFAVKVIAIGNGVGRHEAQRMVDQAVASLPVDVRSALVSEAGASVYSVSPLAQEEYPDEDIAYRGAISIALRLVDPLCQLVKVPPPSLGVGMYQHDIKEKVLEQRLGAVLEEVVSEVGADVNTASQHVLGRTSGLTVSQAAALVSYRAKKGPFRCRDDLKAVKGIGAVTYRNVAGFLRVEGSEPLDSTIVHPEQYAAARDLMRVVMGRSKDLPYDDISRLLFSKQLCAAVANCDWLRIRSDICGGTVDVETLQTIGQWISDSKYCNTATWDVRGIRGVAPRLVRRGLPQPSDLRVGAVLEGTVRNITSFGVFVDIGATEDALLHKSEFGPKTDGFVIGEQLPNITILSVNADRGGKISLTLKNSVPSTAVGGASVSEGVGVKRKAKGISTDASCNSDADRHRSDEGDAADSKRSFRSTSVHAVNNNHHCSSHQPHQEHEQKKKRRGHDSK